MKVYERFKRMIVCDEEELNVKECCFEMERYIQQIEYYCQKTRLRMGEILNELEEDYECASVSEVEEFPELPVEAYKLICEKFGEKVANKIYYDVKLGELPLIDVEKYFLNR